MLNGDVLDLVNHGGISSGATFETFRLVSLAPANSLSLSYRSLARSRIDQEQSLFCSKICERLRYMTL